MATQDEDKLLCYVFSFKDDAFNNLVSEIEVLRKQVQEVSSALERQEEEDPYFDANNDNDDETAKKLKSLKQQLSVIIDTNLQKYSSGSDEHAVMSYYDAALRKVGTEEQSEGLRILNSVVKHLTASKEKRMDTNLSYYLLASYNLIGIIHSNALNDLQLSKRYLEFGEQLYDEKEKWNNARNIEQNTAAFGTEYTQCLFY